MSRNPPGTMGCSVKSNVNVTDLNLKDPEDCHVNICPSRLYRLSWNSGNNGVCVRSAHLRHVLIYVYLLVILTWVLFNLSVRCQYQPVSEFKQVRFRIASK